MVSLSAKGPQRAPDITSETDITSAGPRSPGPRIPLNEDSTAAAFICHPGAILSHSFSWHSHQETTEMRSTAHLPPSLAQYRYWWQVRSFLLPDLLHKM